MSMLITFSGARQRIWFAIQTKFTGMQRERRILATKAAIDARYSNVM